MLLSPGKSGLTSLLKEVRVFKVRALGVSELLRRSVFAPNVYYVVSPSSRGEIPLTQKLKSENPHAHKNRIGTSTPPLSQKTHHPPKGGIYGHGGKNQKCQAPIKSARPFPAPELRAEILWTSRFSDQAKRNNMISN